MSFMEYELVGTEIQNPLCDCLVLDLPKIIIGASLYGDVLIINDGRSFNFCGMLNVKCRLQIEDTGDDSLRPCALCFYLLQMHTF